MARVARTIDYSRIHHLQEQIQDPDYIQGAVDRLAGRITERLLGIDDNPQLALQNAQRSESRSRKDIARFLVDEE